MNFDASVYPYGSHREVVYGRRGMVARLRPWRPRPGWIC